MLTDLEMQKKKAKKQMTEALALQKRLERKHLHVFLDNSRIVLSVVFQKRLI